MSDEVTTTEPVKVAGKKVQAEAIVRKFGLERAIRIVATARKYQQAKLDATFSVDEVTDLIRLTKVHVGADDLAAVVKTRVAEVLG